MLKVKHEYLRQIPTATVFVCLCAGWISLMVELTKLEHHWLPVATHFICCLCVPSLLSLHLQVPLCRSDRNAGNSILRKQLVWKRMWLLQRNTTQLFKQHSTVRLCTVSKGFPLCEVVKWNMISPTTIICIVKSISQSFILKPYYMKMNPAFLFALTQRQLWKYTWLQYLWIAHL